jgi:hypothetical protein
MKPLYWNSADPATGQPYTWDSLNLTWSGILEPGDPGYTPPPPSNPVQPTLKPKRNRMAKSDYIAQNDDQFAAQLQTFKTGIGVYATTLGLSPAQVTAQAADADSFAYVVACQGIMQGVSQQWTAWKNLMRAGGSPPAAGAPMAPVFPPVVAAVALGVEVRFRALVKAIKAHPNYNDAIGQALGIEGAVQTGPDLSTIQPIIDAILSGNAVQIDWGWDGQSAFLDMLELQVDRGSGWALLAFDTTPNYTDTTPLPATPTKWKYRGIYRVGDAQVGVWSNTVEIVVGG